MVEVKQDKDINNSEHIIETLRKQKDTLFKELVKSEDRLKKTEQIYRKYLPYVLELVIDKTNGVSPILNDLKNSIKKKMPIENTESILMRIKDEILNEELALEDEKVQKSSKEQKSEPLTDYEQLANSETNDFSEFKDKYIALINFIKANIDQSYNDKLNSILEKIKKISDWNDISAIHGKLFSIIRQYIEEIESGREKIADFLQDILKKIFSIQASINKSYEHSKDADKSNQTFNLLLNEEINKLKKTIYISKNLDELKSKVSSTLKNIEKALNEKKIKDSKLKKLDKKNQEFFNSCLSKLKNDLATAKQHSQKLEFKLNRDPLTGAFNRRAYNQRLKDEMERFMRYGTIFSMLMLDIDYFKKINDTYGHSVGDKCLQEIIKKTKVLIRKSDMLARYGGEEFVIIMPETDGAGAVALAEKIRQGIEETEFLYKDNLVKVTVSIGVSEVREGDTSGNDIFDRTDTAMYQAKSEGRNRVVLN